MVDDVYIKHLESENNSLKQEVRRLSQLPPPTHSAPPTHSDQANQTNPNRMYRFLTYLRDDDNNMTYGFLPKHTVKLGPFKDLFLKWAHKNVHGDAFKSVDWDEEVACFEQFGLSIQGAQIVGLCLGISSWY
jgi:hypothetical protein